MPEVTVTTIGEGAFWHVAFANGRGNVLDHATMLELTSVFVRARNESALKAICLEGIGEHFSFGASVHEHLPGQVAGMLKSLRDLIFALLESNVFVIAAVRGQCLGGGLELAAVCHRIVASADAKFGQPEIALGVFAPVGSLILVDRVGRARAEELCLTGMAVDAQAALTMGLINEIHPDPAQSAIAWSAKHFGGLSASSLRHAVRAIRSGLLETFSADLQRLEAQYLNELMVSADAQEGVRAFVEKRRPLWKDR